MAQRIGKFALTGAALALLAAAAPPTRPYLDQGSARAAKEPAPAATRVLSPRDAARLRALKGMSLQWISWDRRGKAKATVDARGVWRLRAEQSGPDGAAAAIDGAITEIGADYFELRGTVTIVNTPDAGRTCEGYGTWRFAVTQNRKYYRLRQFEWCDDLTDYVDLYF